MTAQLPAARDALVREHMESENRHDYDAAIATFTRPRYELVATGDIHDGEDAVRRYYAETRAAFPDQRNRVTSLHRADDAIIAEFVLQGTHDGPFRGLPPTGRPFSCPMIAVFEFDPGSDRIACERVFFDASTILRQLGIAHDPLSLRGRIATALNHPVTIASAFLRQAVRRRQ